MKTAILVYFLMACTLMINYSAPGHGLVVKLYLVNSAYPGCRCVSSVRVGGKIHCTGFKRSASLVNGVFPGPLVSVNKGDVIKVNVTNCLFDPTMRRSTSIHWHGILQPRDAFNDGASFVTQCPISQNQSYLYTILPEKQTGTYWYHSHLSTQYVDGIRGPLIIYDPEDPLRLLYDVDDSNTVITLADWYHNTALNATNSFVAGSIEPTPDVALVNGIGRFPGGPSIPWARINVQPGKRYRFRVINMSAAGAFEFSIDKHCMTVIEADGVAHKSYTVDSLPVLPGQRYSVVVKATQKVDNYWISPIMSDIFPGFKGPTNSTFAVLHYAGAPDADPTIPPPLGLTNGSIEFEEFKLEPLENPGAPRGDRPADQVLNLTFAPDVAHHPNGNSWLINGSPYKSPSVPTLLNILANGFTNESRFASSENTFILKHNALIEVNLIGGTGHPFHLHGHTFDVVQSASGGPANFKNPPRRDVVSSGGTADTPVRLRFVTDNPGPWFLHCHLEWHFTSGLAAVMAEDPKGIQSGPKSVKPSAQWDRLCDIYNKLPLELQ